MPISGSTQWRLVIYGAGRDHPDWLVASDRVRWSRAFKGRVSLCSGLYCVNASDETFHFPLSLKLGNGAART